MRWVRRLILAAAFGVSCVAAYWLGSPRDNQRSDPPVQVIDGLAVETAALDLGEVWEEKGYVSHLPIRNQTGADIQVRDFSIGCDCLAVTPRSLTIPARQNATVSLDLDLAHRSPVDLNAARRPFAVEVTPVTKSFFSRQPGWRVRGVILSRVTLDALSVHFGETPVHGQPTRPQTVLATVHVPAQGLEATVDPKVATVQVSRLPDSDDRYRLAITVQPTLPPGPFKSEVTVTVLTPAGERLPGETLPILGQMQPEVRPLPARMLLGSQPVGETAEAVVVLQAPEGVDVAVERIDAESADVQVEAVTAEGTPAGRAFRVRQQVTKEGDQASTVRFFIRKAGRPAVPVEMQVCYRGMLPEENRPTRAGREQP
jgi:hypothetical protein